jgi:anti-sigma regulatory factor (Ser/Thr protein kinase)
MKDGVGELIQYRLVMEPRAAGRARQVVGSVLDGWPLGGLADDVVSCVSELVANVYEHAAKSATAELLVSWIPGHSLTVEVRDRDSRMPRRRRTAGLGVLPLALIDTDTRDWRIMELAEAGRGLGLVDALCDRLTWQPNSGGGKAVRCQWRLKTADHTPRNCPGPSDRAEGIDTATPA